MSTFCYFAFYKPYQVLSQFTKENNHVSLQDYISVSKDVYPIGRLDYDSEGLLLLTNDIKLNHRLLHPFFKHHREYWVQVEGMAESQQIERLCKGVTIRVENKPYQTYPCEASVFNPSAIYPRHPPIRERKNIPTTWIKMLLFEGKNRQVRKMTAQVGLPTLRLIRYRMGNITLSSMKPGELLPLTTSFVYKHLFE